MNRLPFSKTPEWCAMRDAARSVRCPARRLTPEEIRAAVKAKHRQKRKEYLAAHPELTKPKHERQHAMRRDSRSGCWMVGVPRKDGGNRHWISTGEKDIGEALKVIDASGIERLSILARAKCLTADVAQLIMAGRATTCAEVIRQWVWDLRLDQAKKTASVYVNFLRQLAKRCGALNQPVSSITREQLYNYVNDPSVKQSTREVRLAAINSFYRHAAGYAHVIGNIAQTVRLNKSLLTVEQRERVPAVPFTEAEYRCIMANPDVPPFWRWASALGWWLGLRSVDVANYQWASITDTYAKLYPQKTGRELLLPLQDPLIGGGELRRVFDEMRLSVGPHANDPYCFPKAKHHYDTRGKLSQYEGGFRAALRLCGIEGKSFHGFRHSFKLRLQQSGKPIEEISRLMGHASIQTTMGYGRGEKTA